MSTVQKTRKSLLPQPPGWLKTLPTALRPYLAPPIRVEEYVTDHRYVVRAEIAGADPDKDVEVRVASGRLTIVERRPTPAAAPRHSEFRHGTLTRTVPLPRGVDEQDVTTSCSNGMLEVSVGLTEPTPARRIAITEEVTPPGD